MNESEKTAEVQQIKSSAKATSLSFVKRHPVLTTALAGILLIVAVYLWKDIQRKKQVAAVELAADAQLKQNSDSMLHLMAKPLVWSIRSEMLKGNLEQVNIYVAELVKEPNIDIIYIVDPDGIIIVSTDKKLEGQLISDKIDKALLQTDSVHVSAADAGMLTLAAPVMGFEKRMATIILNYQAPAFNREKNIK